MGTKTTRVCEGKVVGRVGQVWCEKGMAQRAEQNRQCASAKQQQAGMQKAKGWCAGRMNPGVRQKEGEGTQKCKKYMHCNGVG